MATEPGRACAQSVGERKIIKTSKSRFKKIGHSQRGLSCCISLLWRKFRLVNIVRRTYQCCFVRLSIRQLLEFFDRFLFRLQREEEEAYASRQQRTQSQPSITPVNKYEERKTKERSSKTVTKVTGFFTPSTKTPPKKGKHWVGQNWSFYLFFLKTPFTDPEHLAFFPSLYGVLVFFCESTDISDR